MYNKEHLQQYLLAVILIGILVLGFFIVRPYLNALILAGALAVVFMPVYRNMRALVANKRGIASLLTIFVIMFLVLIPLLFLGTLVFGQARDLYLETVQGNNITSIHALALALEEAIQKVIPDSFGFLNLTQYAEGLLGWLVGNLSSAFSSVVQGLVSFVLSMFMLYYLFKDGPALKRFLIEHSPLPDTYDLQITERIKGAVNSVVKGSLTIAVIQGIITGIGFTIFNIPNPALWGGLATIAALVPTVGTALIIGPAVAYLLIVSQFGNALGLMIWGTIAVGMIDNFLGPRLIGKNTHMHPLVVFLSVLGGISFFGPIGFLLGPLVFSMFFVLLDIYVAASQHKNLEAPHEE